MAFSLEMTKILQTAFGTRWIEDMTDLFEASGAISVSPISCIIWQIICQSLAEKMSKLIQALS